MSKLNSEFKVQIKCTAAKQGSFSKFLSRVNHSLLVTSKALSLYLLRVPQIWMKQLGMTDTMAEPWRWAWRTAFPWHSLVKDCRETTSDRPAPEQSRRGPQHSRGVCCIRALKRSFVPRITDPPLALSASHHGAQSCRQPHLYFFQTGIEFCFIMLC